MLICACSDYRPANATYKGPEGETTVIDRVLLSSDPNGKLCIKFIVRHTRRPEVSGFHFFHNVALLLDRFVFSLFDHLYSWVINSAVDMVRKVYVAPLFSRRIFPSLNVASAPI